MKLIKHTAENLNYLLHSSMFKEKPTYFSSLNNLSDNIKKKHNPAVIKQPQFSTQLISHATPRLFNLRSGRNINTVTSRNFSTFDDGKFAIFLIVQVFIPVVGALIAAVKPKWALKFINKVFYINENLLHLAKTEKENLFSKASSYADINYQDSQKMTALHHAIEAGNTNVALEIISRNPDFSITNNCGRTTLYDALSRGNVTVINAIINQILHGDYKPKVYINNKESRKLIHDESELKRLILKKIFRIDSKKYWTTLCTPIAYRHTASALSLLNKRNEGLIEVQRTNILGQTALFWAVKTKNIQVLRRLIELKADVKGYHTDGSNVFHIAARASGIRRNFFKEDLNDNLEEPFIIFSALTRLPYSIPYYAEDKSKKSIKDMMNGRVGEIINHGYKCFEKSQQPDYEIEFGYNNNIKFSLSVSPNTASLICAPLLIEKCIYKGKPCHAIKLCFINEDNQRSDIIISAEEIALNHSEESSANNVNGKLKSNNTITIIDKPSEQHQKMEYYYTFNGEPFIHRSLFYQNINFYEDSDAEMFELQYSEPFEIEKSNLHRHERLYIKKSDLHGRTPFQIACLYDTKLAEFIFRGVVDEHKKEYSFVGIKIEKETLSGRDAHELLALYGAYRGENKDKKEYTELATILRKNYFKKSYASKNESITGENIECFFAKLRFLSRQYLTDSCEEKQDIKVKVGTLVHGLIKKLKSNEIPITDLKKLDSDLLENEFKGPGYTLFHYLVRFNDSVLLNELLCTIKILDKDISLYDIFNKFGTKNIFGNVLFEAVVFGALDVVIYLLKGKMHFDSKDFKEESEFGVDFEVDFDQTENNKFCQTSSLLGAAMTARPELIRILIKHAKEKYKNDPIKYFNYINQLSYSGRTALTYVIENYYRNYKSDENMDSVQRELLEILEFLLKENAQVNNLNSTTISILSKEKFKIYEDYFEPPLHTAVRVGHERLVRLLLSYGANTNLGDNNGATALHLACLRNNFSVVRILIEEGYASVFLKNEDGMYPIDLCGNSPSYAVLKNYLKTLMMERNNMNYTSKNDYASKKYLSSLFLSSASEKNVKQSDKITVSETRRPV